MSVKTSTPSRSMPGASRVRPGAITAGTRAPIPSADECWSGRRGCGGCRRRSPPAGPRACRAAPDGERIEERLVGCSGCRRRVDDGTVDLCDSRLTAPESGWRTTSSRPHGVQRGGGIEQRLAFLMALAATDMLMTWRPAACRPARRRCASRRGLENRLMTCGRAGPYTSCPRAALFDVGFGEVQQSCDLGGRQALIPRYAGD